MKSGNNIDFYNDIQSVSCQIKNKTTFNNPQNANDSDEK